MKHSEYCAKCERPVTDVELETGVVRFQCEYDVVFDELVSWYEHIYECTPDHYLWEQDPDAWKV